MANEVPLTLGDGSLDRTAQWEMLSLCRHNAPTVRVLAEEIKKLTILLENDNPDVGRITKQMHGLLHTAGQLDTFARNLRHAYWPDL